MTEKRDLVSYAEQYESLPFEPTQAHYRRKLILSQIEQVRPIRLLEIGCGQLPLFTNLPKAMDVTVVEPAETFFSIAKNLTNGMDNVKVLHGFIETIDLNESEFDMIILSCVLHEVSAPSTMLKAIRRLCHDKTILHVNVPNAHSLHRQLAVSMGLIRDPAERSETQRRMQQRGTVYCAKSLRDELRSSGFQVFDEGSCFVKPFTHSQMQALIESGFMTGALLDGLDGLAKRLPDIGSEIWANACIDASWQA